MIFDWSKERGSMHHLMGRFCTQCLTQSMKIILRASQGIGSAFHGVWQSRREHRKKCSIPSCYQFEAWCCPTVVLSKGTQYLVRPLRSQRKWLLYCTPITEQHSVMKQGTIQHLSPKSRLRAQWNIPPPYRPCRQSLPISLGHQTFCCVPGFGILAVPR